MNAAFKIIPATWGEDRERLLMVRETVFVIEQGVPAEIEVDEYDPVSIHVLACELENGTPIGTARLLPEGKIGRVAVLEKWRRHGIGEALMRDLINTAEQRGDRELLLHGQSHTVGFYERCGFVAEGAEFMEAGIPHRTMRRVF